MDAAKRVELQMDTLEAIADAWAGEVDLPAMIRNATSPMALTAAAPCDVRGKFHDRMKAQVFAVAQQAFIEGVCRGVMLVNDEIKSMQAKTDDGKDAAAVSLGRRGGKARSEKLSPSQRTSIAKRAADKRWKKQR